MPRVSVVVPNYNHDRFLERRIQSVLEQTYQDLELILLDDASTDHSIRILEKYRSNPGVRIVINDKNSGSPFAQWNRGVQLACGEYIWIAEADDDAEPELLATLVQELDNHPSAVLAYCQSWIVDDRGSRVRTMLSWTDDLDKTRWKRNFRSSGSEEARRYLIFKNTIPNASAVVFRRSVFLQAGGAPPSMRLAGDWMTWVLLACRGDVVFVSIPLNLFREHSGTVRSSTTKLCLLHEWFKVIRATELNLGIPNELRQALAIKLLNEWHFEYACHRHPISLSIICRVGSFLWRMDCGAAIKFFLFFLLLKMPDRFGLQPARKLWRVFQRVARARVRDP